MLGDFITMLMRLRWTYGTAEYFAINAREIEKANEGGEVIELD